MDLLDRLLEHDAWTTRQLLLCALPLPDARLDQRFDLGPGALRATLHHLIRNMEIWSALMAGEAPPGAAYAPAEMTIEGMIARLDDAAARFGRVARAVRDRAAWDDTFVDTLDDPPVAKTYGGAIAHLITHSMHHRGQAIFMLRRLGAAGVPEGDALSWERAWRAGDADPVSDG